MRGEVLKEDLTSDNLTLGDPSVATTRLMSGTLGVNYWYGRFVRAVGQLRRQPVERHLGDDHDAGGRREDRAGVAAPLRHVALSGPRRGAGPARPVRIYSGGDEAPPARRVLLLALRAPGTEDGGGVPGVPGDGREPDRSRAARPSASSRSSTSATRSRTPWWRACTRPSSRRSIATTSTGSSPRWTTSWTSSRRRPSGSRSTTSRR